MKKNVLIVFLIFFFFMIFIYVQNNTFKVKISLIFQNKTAYDVDCTWAQNLNFEFLKIAGIKEVHSVSSNNLCNIYLKFNPFLLNYGTVLSEIKIKFDSIFNNLNFCDEKIIVDFDLNYNKKYDYLLVFSFLEDDFEQFLDFENRFLNNIKNNLKTTKIKTFPSYPYASYLYFGYDNLQKFNLDIEKIKNTIVKNNNNSNFFNKTLKNSIYSANISSDIDNISDIKNLVIPFLLKTYAIKLGEIFEVKNGLRYFGDSKVVFKDNNSIIFLISKKWYYPSFLYEKMLDNYLNSDKSFSNLIKYKLYKISSLSKFEILPDKNADFREIQKEISSKIKDDDSIYFLKFDNPKIFKNEFLSESNNKITIVFLKNKKNKIRKILSNLDLDYKKQEIPLSSDSLNNLFEKIDDKISNYKKTNVELTKKENVISYKIDNFFLNDYEIDKVEVINSLIANNDGLILDYYFNSFYKIPIILKNKEENLNTFVYSKQNNTLLDINSFLKSEITSACTQITRRNGKYFALVEIF